MRLLISVQRAMQLIATRSLVRRPLRVSSFDAGQSIEAQQRADVEPAANARMVPFCGCMYRARRRRGSARQDRNDGTLRDTRHVPGQMSQVRIGRSLRPHTISESRPRLSLESRWLLAHFVFIGRAAT